MNLVLLEFKIVTHRKVNADVIIFYFIVENNTGYFIITRAEASVTLELQSYVSASSKDIKLLACMNKQFVFCVKQRMCVGAEDGLTGVVDMV